VRKFYFDILGKIMELELESWFLALILPQKMEDIKDKIDLELFGVEFFEVESSLILKLREHKRKILDFEKTLMSAKEKDEILRNYQKELRVLVKKCTDEILCMTGEDATKLIDACKPKLKEYIEKSEKLAYAALHEKHCMSSKNPMRQHTASFNPIPLSAVDWYGKENYVSFRVGFPDEIYFLVKQLGLRYGIAVNVLVPYFARAWAEGMVETQKQQIMIGFQDKLHRKYADQVITQRNKEEVVKPFHHILKPIKVIFGEATKEKQRKREEKAKKRDEEARKQLEEASRRREQEKARREAKTAEREERRAAMKARIAEKKAAVAEKKAIASEKRQAYNEKMSKISDALHVAGITFKGEENPNNNNNNLNPLQRALQDANEEPNSEEERDEEDDDYISE
jgi:hypothetical protein